MTYTIDGKTYTIVRDAVVHAINGNYSAARNRPHPEQSDEEHAEECEARRREARRLEKVLAELDAGKAELSKNLYPSR